LLVWELRRVGGLDEIIFGPLSIILYVLGVFFYVCVELILHE
jgi:hypothetical protein